MSDLLHCPFCGGEADFSTDNSDVFSMAGCTSCGVSQPSHQNEAEAIAAWNARASQWISVEDRLPEDNMAPVLIPGGIGLCIHGLWHSTMDSGERNPIPVTWEVTHWQPLPNPPETP